MTHPLGAGARPQHMGTGCSPAACPAHDGVLVATGEWCHGDALIGATGDAFINGQCAER